MSQTIEEIIAQKEQELGLNEEQLNALKDYATKSLKFLGIYQPLIDESAEAKNAIKTKKVSVAMKTTNGTLKGVGVVADVSIYIQQGDSLPKAITKAVVDVATSDFIDYLVLRGFGKGAEITEYSINAGGVVADFKSPGELAATDAVKWTDWAWDYYIGPNVVIKRTENFIFIKSKNGSISHILHANWDGGWNAWFNNDKYLQSYSKWKIRSEENGDNETIAFDGTANLLTIDGYRTDRSYDHLTDVLGYLAKNGIEHIDVSINKGGARAVTSFIGHINGMEDGSWLAANASNAKIFYAIQTLKGYVFDNDVNITDGESSFFSDKYIQDRAKFTALVVNQNFSAEGKDNVADYMKGKNIVYQDLSQNIYIGDNSNGHYTKIVFMGNSSENFRETGWITYNVYGGNGTNQIYTAQMNDYIEGGEGSDTIYSYGGDDIIYTNANLRDEDYDMEDSGTTNTVFAGDGDDHIYGSDGRDEIYADDDNRTVIESQYSNDDVVEGRGGKDTIYGGGDDDILYGDRADSHADTSGDYIVGGLGADKIYGSDGDEPFMVIKIQVLMMEVYLKIMILFMVMVVMILSMAV